MSVVILLVVMVFLPVDVVTYDSSAHFRKDENFCFITFKAFDFTFTFDAAFAN